MNFTGVTDITPGDTLTAFAAGDINAGSATGFGRLRLGTKGRTRDGRTFVFCRVGGVATAPGKLYQSAAPTATHLAQTPAAAALGATSVTITSLGAAAAVNQYAEGYLQVDDSTGAGIMYGIEGHLVNAGSAALVVNLAKDDPINVALTTSSRVGLIASPFADVILTPTTRTGLCIGYPLIVAAAGSYCWFQTWGPCACLINGTPAVTAPAINSVTTTGALDVWTAAAQPTSQMIGEMMQVGVSTKYNAVYLKIAQ